MHRSHALGQLCKCSVVILGSAWVFVLTGCSVSDSEGYVPSADPLVPIEISMADGDDASDPLPVGYLFLAGGDGVHAHLSRQDDRRFAIDWRVADDRLTISFGFGIEATISTVEFDDTDSWQGQSDLHGALRCERTAL